MKAEKQRYHKSIDTMPIIPFDALLRGGGTLASLLIGDNDASESELTEAYNAMAEQYMDEVSKRAEVAQRSKLEARMMAIKIEYESVMRLLSIAEKHFDENIQAALKVWKCDLPSRNHIPMVRKKINALRTKFEDLAFEAKQTEKKATKRIDLQESAYQIERFYSTVIDLNKTTVKKWLIIENQYIIDVQKHKQNGKSKGIN
jgi:hypothetical protein